MVSKLYEKNMPPRQYNLLSIQSTFSLVLRETILAQTLLKQEQSRNQFEKIRLNLLYMASKINLMVVQDWNIQYQKSFKIKKWIYLLHEQDVMPIWQLVLPQLPYEVEPFLLSMQRTKNYYKTNTGYTQFLQSAFNTIDYILADYKTDVQLSDVLERLYNKRSIVIYLKGIAGFLFFRFCSFISK